MSDIGNVQGTKGIGPIQPIAGKAYQAAQKAETPIEDQDTVQISQVAELLGKIRDLPDIRIEKVAPIRQAIMNEKYDMDSRMDTALDRLLEDLT